MAETYRIETLTDLLKVPADRRRAMFEEIEQALLLYELAWGESDPSTHAPMVITWTDDGCRDTTLHTPEGEPVLSLQVTKREEAAHG